MGILLVPGSVPSVSGFKLVDHAMCKDVGADGTCRERTNVFLTTDEWAYIWLKGTLEQSDVGAEVKFAFYNPSGELYAEGPWSLGPFLTWRVSKPGPVMGWMRIGITRHSVNGSIGGLSWWMTLTGKLPSQMPGEWRAEFTLAGTVIVRERFTIRQPDSDGDGLTDSEEATIGTNPNNPDTDADGLNDAYEVRNYKTNPLKADTDGDGLTDNIEIDRGTNPLMQDTDGDSWIDSIDIQPRDALVPNVFLIVLVIAATGLVAWRLLLRRRKATEPAVATTIPAPAPTAPAMQATAAKYCFNCGAQISAQAAFCEICGQKQAVTSGSVTR